MFTVNDVELFVHVFSPLPLSTKTKTKIETGNDIWLDRRIAKLRDDWGEEGTFDLMFLDDVHVDLKHSFEAYMLNHNPLPASSHFPLHWSVNSGKNLKTFFVLWLMTRTERLERWIFEGLMRARFVEGDEPWGYWQRAREKGRLSSVNAI